MLSNPPAPSAGDPAATDPGLPRFSGARTLKLRARIADEILFPFYGDRVEGPQAADIAHALAAAIPRARLDILHASVLAQLLGRTLGPAEVAEFAGRTAGNVDRLTRPLHPTAVGPWTRQEIPEWMAAGVASATWCTLGRARRRGAELAFAVVAGTFAPGVARRRYTDGQCESLGRLIFGFGRGHRLVDPHQLVNLRCFILVEPALSLDGGPGIAKLAVNATMAAWNRAVVRRRHRASLRRPSPADACPHSQPIDRACHACAFGYRECYAGTHRDRWVAVDCEACGLAGRAADPAATPGLCINCDKKARTSRREA